MQTFYIFLFAFCLTYANLLVLTLFDTHFLTHAKTKGEKHGEEQNQN